MAWKVDRLKWTTLTVSSHLFGGGVRQRANLLNHSIALNLPNRQRVRNRPRQHHPRLPGFGIRVQWKAFL